MNKEIVRFTQERLRLLGYSPGPIDGLIGRKTISAIGKAACVPHDWSDERKLIGFIQYLAKEERIDTGIIDGYWGPQTEYAFEEFVDYLEKGQLKRPWRDLIHSTSEAIVTSITSKNDWPNARESELEKYYGKIGENQTYLILPYKHKLAWDLGSSISRYSCHEKVHDSLGRILQRVLDHYGETEIERLRLDQFGGCFNKRKMRGGTKWSMHSWGIAVDYDPSHNKLRWDKSKASFAKLAYDEWWKIWESEGWLSLGRMKDYDWMHIQATKP